MSNLYEYNFAFLEALARVRTFEKKIIKQRHLNITPVELNYLALIESGKSMKQSDLLVYLDVSKGTLSNMIKSLIFKKFVIRKTSKEDKRVKKLRLTKQGMKILDVSIDIRMFIKNYIESKLTKDEVKTFLKLAYKLR